MLAPICVDGDDAMDCSKTPAAAAPSPKEGELDDDKEDKPAEEELVWFGMLFGPAAARALISSGEIQVEETHSPGGRAWYASIRRRSSAVNCAFGCISLDTAKRAQQYYSSKLNSNCRQQSIVAMHRSRKATQRHRDRNEECTTRNNATQKE